MRSVLVSAGRQRVSVLSTTLTTPVADLIYCQVPYRTKLAVVGPPLPQPTIKRCDQQESSAIGTILLYVRVVQSLIRFILENLSNFANLDFFGSVYINDFIKAILYTDRTIMRHNSAPVSIHTVHGTETDKRGKQNVYLIINLKTKKNFKNDLVEMARTVTLKPLPETSDIDSINV